MGGVFHGEVFTFGRVESIIIIIIIIVIIIIAINSQPSEHLASATKENGLSSGYRLSLN